MSEPRPSDSQISGLNGERPEAARRQLSREPQCLETSTTAVVPIFPRGAGVVLDDLVARVFALIIVQVVTRWMM